MAIGRIVNLAVVLWLWALISATVIQGFGIMIFNEECLYQLTRLLTLASMIRHLLNKSLDS